jgi:hypothetical protein
VLFEVSLAFARVMFSVTLASAPPPAKLDVLNARGPHTLFHGSVDIAGEILPPPVVRYRRLRIKGGQGRGGLDKFTI